MLATTIRATWPGSARIWQDEDRQEELEFAREAFAALQELYQRAAAQGQLVVCEIL
jgi:hypothetical protein